MLERAMMKHWERLELLNMVVHDTVGLHSLFFFSFSLLGHGDQRHAVYCDRVCKEWRDVW